jgi:hypothetical protein
MTGKVNRATSDNPKTIFDIFAMAMLTDAIMMQLITRPSLMALKILSMLLDLETPYLNLTKSTSVTTSLRLQYRARKKIAPIEPIAPAHQNQLAEIPLLAVSPVTHSGVSDENVVATMEVPATNQPNDRPAKKKSSSLDEAFFVKYNPIPIEIRIKRIITA